MAKKKELPIDPFLAFESLETALDLPKISFLDDEPMEVLDEADVSSLPEVPVSPMPCPDPGPGDRLDLPRDNDLAGPGGATHEYHGGDDRLNDRAQDGTSPPCADGSQGNADGQSSACAGESGNPAGGERISPEPGCKAGVDISAGEDPELVEIFLEEASDLLDACDDAVAALVEDGSEALTEELNRYLHTIKGSARMAGFNGIGSLSHALESLVNAMGEVAPELKKTMFGYLSQGLDQMRNMAEAVAHQEVAGVADGLIDQIGRLTRGDGPEAEPAKGEAPAVDQSMPGAPTDASTSAGDVVRTSEDTVATSREDSIALQDHPAGVAGKIADTDSSLRESDDRPEFVERTRPAQEQGPSRESGNKAVSAQDVVRVDARVLDKLVNLSGEVSIYRSRMEQQLLEFGYGLGELTQTIERLRGQLRKLEMETEAQILFQYEKENVGGAEEFDPLELDRYSTIQQLSRALSESVTDLTSIKELLGNRSRDSQTLLEQQSRVSVALQEQLMQTRMVRFGSIARRLHRIVRQTSAELSKDVTLSIFGEDNEIDRSVLNRMVSPLEHILRNAISHGIESPADRKGAGKPPQGSVRVGVSREGAEVVIKISDDGAGIDRESVRHKAKLMGLVSDDRELSDDNVLQLILESGFSTAKELTHVSGRGVGMDVVHSEVKKLGGILSVESEPGLGTTFYVRLPYTLAVNEALLIEAGEELYAVPLTNIEGIIRVDSAMLGKLYALTEPVFTYGGSRYRLMNLAELVGLGSPTFESSLSMFPMLLIRAGERRMAIQVDGLLGTREVVAKPLGGILEKLKGVSGATILGDGRVVLILDVTGLYWLGTNLVARVRERVYADDDDSSGQKKIMVVDDSITIRKVTSRLLRRNDFAVMTAKDGVDALQVLQEELPDLILLDIEMPRMDGYELASHIRNNSRLRDLPIIMITSRTGDKHRQRALDIGVDRYLGKPYQETDLLEAVREMLDRANASGDPHAEKAAQSGEG